MHKKYDLKVGYSCNNHCIHCVIRPNVWRLKDCGHLDEKDSTYKEIVDCMNSQDFKEAKDIVITGGEPTIRKEFLRILKYIHKNYPEKRICLQTNGRRLKDYVKEIHEMGININFVIALHGFEALHNEVTGCRSGNPYQETWESIQELKKYYQDINSILRIEIVLSNKNLHATPKFVEYLYENGFRHIGISYPHLDGYAFKSIDLAREIGFSYAEFKKYVPRYYDILLRYKDIKLGFEAVPRCMWRDENDKLLDLLENMYSMTHSINNQIAVKYPGQEVNADFTRYWAQAHRQSSLCNQCVYCCNCLGVWVEAIMAYGDQGFVPVKENELKEVYACVSC